MLEINKVKQHVLDIELTPSVLCSVRPLSNYLLP